MVKMRKIFNIKRRVELLEEKIRKNFEYWVRLCNDKIEYSSFFNKLEIVLFTTGNLL